MDIVYMGTPDFAVGALKSVIEAGHNVKLVVTQPDKVRGRGKEVSYCPVKEEAIAHGIEVFQPVRIRDAQNVERLKSIAADVYVVAAFGQILSQEILDIPRYGCINIHASLLPKYRGAAPIQWCILNGEKETGITIMQMDKGVDTGDILLQKKLDIDPKETGASLFDKLAVLGGETIVEALDAIEKGKITPVKQDESKATHVGMLSKDMGRIVWSDAADKIERYVRGLNSWPCTYTYTGGKLLKIWEADTDSCDEGEAPGRVLRADKTGIYVATGKGCLVIKSLQLEGKKRMESGAFLLGYSIKPGDILG